MYYIERIVERIMTDSPQHSIVNNSFLRYGISRVGLCRRRYKVMGVKDCLKPFLRLVTVNFSFILEGKTYTGEALKAAHHNVLRPAIDNPVSEKETVQVIINGGNLAVA